MHTLHLLIQVNLQRYLLSFNHCIVNIDFLPCLWRGFTHLLDILLVPVEPVGGSLDRLVGLLHGKGEFSGV
jgi:hypothetical protein